MNNLSVFRMQVGYGYQLYDVFNYDYIERRSNIILDWYVERVLLNNFILLCPLREMCVLFDETRS